MYGRVDYCDSALWCLGLGALSGGGKDEEKDELDKVAKVQLSLEPKDYLALAIASLETIFLPLLILAVVLFALLLILR